MASERPDDKFIPISIETLGRTGQTTQDFLRDSCSHLLTKQDELSHVRAQLNTTLWAGNAELDLWSLRMDHSDANTDPVFFDFFIVAGDPGFGVKTLYFPWIL